MTTYTIQFGDTLGKIAQKFYGDSSRYKEIAEANNIENPNVISVGQTVNIPDIETEDEENQALVEKVAGGIVLMAAQLQEIMPAASTANIDKYLNPLNSGLPKFEIVTPLRVCHFIAQIAHESGSFQYNTENLNYSAAALMSVFGKYFPTEELANEYADNRRKSPTGFTQIEWGTGMKKATMDGNIGDAASFN